MPRLRVPVIAGITCLAVATAFAVWPPNEVAQLLAFVLAGCSLRFVTLPGPIEAPDRRRSGALLAVPFIVSMLFIMLGVETRGKTRDGDLMMRCGQILFCEWVVLAVWEQHRNRPRSREASM